MVETILQSKSDMFEWLDYAFMTRALVATTVLSFSVTPIGVFLVLSACRLPEKRWHTQLFRVLSLLVVAGLTMGSMVIGGLIAGVTVAALIAYARGNNHSRRCKFGIAYLMSCSRIFGLSAAGSRALKAFYLVQSLVSTTKASLCSG